MIWWLTSDTLMKKYVKRTEEEIQNTNFLLLSSRINCTEVSDNVMNVYNVFICVNTLKGVGLMDEPNSPEALAGFTKFLMNSPTVMSFLATIIQNDFTTSEDTVFVTTKDEKKIFGMNTFIDAIANLFGYRINEYPDRPEYSYSDVLSRVIHYMEEADNALIDRMPIDKKIETLQRRSKKELRRMVEEDPRYIPGMKREDMIDLVVDRKSGW